MNKKNLFAALLATQLHIGDISSILTKGEFNIGVQQALAGDFDKQNGKVEHVNSPLDIASKWKAEDVFYVQGRIPVSDRILQSLTKDINSKYPDTQFTFFFTGDNPSNFHYTNRNNENLSGKSAIDFALSETLTQKTDLTLGKKHVVIWISFVGDNNGKRWVRSLTSAEFDELGIGEDSDFSSTNGELFSRVFPQLKNGNIVQAIKIITDGYDLKYNEIVEKNEADKKRKETLKKIFTDPENISVMKNTGAGLVLIIASIFGILANRKRKPTKEEFEKEIVKWKEALNKAREDLMLEIRDKQDIFSILHKDSTGITKEKIDQLSKDVGLLAVLLPKLTDTIDYIEKEVGSDYGLNLVSSKGYEKGLDLLINEEFVITPSTDRLDSNLLELLGNEKIDSLDDLEDMLTYTFKGMVENANEKILSIRGVFDEFKDANEFFDKTYDKCLEYKDELDKSLIILSEKVGEKSINNFPFISEFLENFNINLVKVSNLSKSDKLNAYQILLDTSFKLKRFSKSIEDIAGFIETEKPYGTKNELELNNYNLEWFNKEISIIYSELGKESGSVFDININSDSFKGVISILKSRIIDLYLKLNSVKEISIKSIQLNDNTLGLKSRIESIRKDISINYNISGNLLFNEKGHIPEKHFSQIDNFNSNIINLLNEGDIIKAKEIILKIEKLLEEVNVIIDMTQKGFEIFEERKLNIEKVSKKILLDIQNSDQLLSYMKDKWSKGVLDIKGGDRVYKTTDFTLSNNTDEVEYNQLELIKIIKGAKLLIDKGLVIQSIGELDRAVAINEDSQERINEINEKYNILEQLEGDNLVLLDVIDVKINELENENDKNYIVEKSRNKFGKLLEENDNIFIEVNKAKVNPIIINELLNTFINKLGDLSAMFLKDKQVYNDLGYQIKEVNNQLNLLKKRGEKAQYDNFPDSEKAKEIFEINIPKSIKDFNIIEDLYMQNHIDWYIILNRVEKILLNINIDIDFLRDEKEGRKESEEKIRKAKSKINQVRNWSGRYGIGISGRYGINEFTQSENLYFLGNFDEAYKYAEKAYKIAKNAIDDADEEVLREKRRRDAIERRKREEANRKEREADERRRRRRTSSDDSWSSGGSSGFGGGGSFSSSSSGFGGGGSW